MVTASGDSIANVTLLGRLTEPPQIRGEDSPDGKHVARLIVATGEGVTTVFHEVKVFGARALECAQLKLGRRLYIEGHLTSYGSRVEIVGRKVVFL